MATFTFYDGLSNTNDYLYATSQIPWEVFCVTWFIFSFFFPNWRMTDAAFDASQKFLGLCSECLSMLIYSLLLQMATIVKRPTP